MHVTGITHPQYNGALSSGQVPHSDCPVCTTTCQLPAIGAESDTKHFVDMPLYPSAKFNTTNLRFFGNIQNNTIMQR